MPEPKWLNAREDRAWRAFVFARADDAVRAWTEVGFRREPIFADHEAEEYRILAGVLPSLQTARAGLRQRAMHDGPDAWWRRLQQLGTTPDG